MSISGRNPTHDDSTVPEYLRQRTPRWRSEIPGYAELADYGTAATDAPYPVMRPTSAWEIHVVPLDGSLWLWLVDPETNQVRVEARCSAGQGFESGGPESMIERLERTADNWGWPLDDGTLTRIRQELEELFADPFDQDLRHGLRRLLAVRLKRLTNTVEAVESRQYHGTKWTLTMEHPEASGFSGEFEIELPTRGITAQYPTSFRNKYRAKTHQHLRNFRNATWFIWYEIGLLWLGPNAVIRSYAEHELIDAPPETFQFRQSATGTVHLCNQHNGRPVCQHGISEAIAEADFHPAALPVGTALCVQCSKWVKQLVLKSTAERIYQ